MANITITVQSLLNTAVYDSYTIDDGQTIDQLKTAVNSARGFDSSWYNIVLNQHVVSGSATLASLGIVTGTVLRTANVIDRLATKELRQRAKLDLSELDRTAGGNPRSTYDITELPTQYSGNNIVDNPQPAGLILGRPWTTGSVTALFVSLAAEAEIIVDDTTGISPGMIVTGTGFTSETVTVVAVNSSTSLTLSIIAPDPVPAPGTVLTFTNP